MSYGIPGLGASLSPMAAYSAKKPAASYGTGGAADQAAATPYAGAYQAASGTQDAGSALGGLGDLGGSLGQILPLLSQLLNSISGLLGGGAFQGALDSGAEKATGEYGAKAANKKAGGGSYGKGDDQAKAASMGGAYDKGDAKASKAPALDKGDAKAADAGNAAGGGGNTGSNDRTIDPSLVPEGGLNAGNIEEYAGKLSEKFGLSKELILAQVKQESGPDFSDLNHDGDTDRDASQGGHSVGPNQITEGVLKGGIWSNGEDGIDLSPEEARANPALAMQAGLIHLNDYIRQSGGDVEQGLRKYVGHDEDQYIANIRKYGGNI